MCHRFRALPGRLRHARDEEPFWLLRLWHPGRLTFISLFRVLKKGSYVLNSTKDKKERVSRLVILKADERSDVDELRAG